MDQLITLLKEKTGLSDEMADQVAKFIQEHLHELPKLLGGEMGERLENTGLGGLMEHAKGFLGGDKTE